MARYSLVLAVALAVLASNKVYGTVNQVPLPTIDLTEWWGPGNGTAGEDTRIKEFRIKFSPSMIIDLKSRLALHRSFAPPLDGAAFNYGFSSTALESWIKYVTKEYPFIKREIYFNQYAHYTTYIQGLKIHFMRIQTKNAGRKLTPLLILHGWPGSFREFYETIPYLLSFSQSKGIALDIIIPSLPGFGFSDSAVRPGLGSDKAAVIFRNLMHRLGYPKFYVQGGDLGSIIGNDMATLFSDEVLGLHTNTPCNFNAETIFGIIKGSLHPTELAKPEVLSRLYPLVPRLLGLIRETGFIHIQATKPDTVGIGLSDSPSGLIAYMLEKFSTGGRQKFINYPDGGLYEVFTKQQLIDNVMVYWASNSMNTAMRMYAETFNTRYFALRLSEIRTPVPFWIIQTPDDIAYLPELLLQKKFPNILHETLPSEGGHFYALEKPKEFAEDVINSIVAFEQWHTINKTIYEKCSSYISN